MEFRRSLVWHVVVHDTKVNQQPSGGVFKKPTRENLNIVVPSKPRLAHLAMRGTGHLQTSTIRSCTYAPTAWWWQKSSVLIRRDSVGGRCMTVQG